MSLNPEIEVNPFTTEFLENLYQQYQTDPNKIHPSWRHYFESLDHQKFITKPTPYVGKRDNRIAQLIEAYRTYGHQFSKINPIALQEVNEPIHLKLENLGFQRLEKQELFPTHGLLPKEEASLEEIIQILQDLYCGTIGFEYKGFMQNPELEQWIQQQIESGFFKTPLSLEQKKMILEYLNKSEIFESFLHTKYVGQKRFSLEGAETLIPMLALLIEKGGEANLEEVILGMAHRGRINVLSNILQKNYKEIFSEFDEGYIPESFEGTGDVKYHKGYTSDIILTHTGKKIRLTLPPNPSHLESVDPVVEGEVRAKQFLKNDESQRQKIIPILIHGDAALAGQGIVYETLQFCQLPGYQTGGTIHITINNQIGFTTVPSDSRSTRYCTDIAKAFGAPIFHVNAEDPEACVLVALFALEIRQRFHSDVFVDLNCYRKYGHNETDEPAFTQPLEYQIIRKKRPIREIYRDSLIQQGMLEKEIVGKLEASFKKGLQEAHEEVQTKLKASSPKSNLIHAPRKDTLFKSFPTGVSKEVIETVAEHFSIIPPNFRLHPKLENLVKERLNMIKQNKPIDWGMAEYLAYATLVWEGISVRLSGQDSCRGTFSHRHAMWMDQAKEESYIPLAHLKEGQGRFEIWNSPLSELAVLGFEYGYSVAYREGLTIWEAQFGDFNNGAQVIIDQYIASGEQKWGQQSGLTLFLPHGYEGQGPEHSSGRLERFLTLTGHENIQVVNPTTPAQFFHLLRRQALRSVRKPLIVFTPKGLLRYPECISSLDELVQGSFQEILDDPHRPQQVKRIVLCSGRIYYDLIAERRNRKAENLAIIRIEQIYPLNQETLKKIIQSYSMIQDCLWAQEEPQNMGAWLYIRSYLEEILSPEMPLKYVGRPASAAPATGSHSQHQKEFTNILDQVFDL